MTTTAIHPTPTSPEISELREYLEQVRDALLQSTTGLSEAQWNHRPASGGWSIAGLVEHIVLIQELVLGPIAQDLADSEAASADCRVVDELIRANVADRTRKFNAPEFVHPTGRWTHSDALHRMKTNTARLVERLESTPGLRLHRSPSPPLKAMSGGEYELMDGYQWVLTAAGHTERHTKQIAEVKSEPGFPAS